jgi:predicted DNA-binding protein
MLKEVSMSFRVDTALRDQFGAAAEAERRPASQVLRELMHKYVEDAERVHGSMATRHAWQQNRRRADFANAQASIELEGYEVPEAMEAVAEQFMRQEIGIDALLAKADELAGR